MAIFECNVGDKFTWIKGDNLGKEDIVRLPSTRVGAMNFIEFVSGRRCSIAVAKEYIQLIGTAEELGIENPEEFVKKLDENSNKPAANQKVAPKQQAKVDNLYKAMLEKIKNYEDSELTLTLKISLPKKDTLKVLLEAYGDDFKQELNNYINEKVSTDVKGQLEIQIDNWVNNLNQ